VSETDVDVVHNGTVPHTDSESAEAQATGADDGGGEAPADELNDMDSETDADADGDDESGDDADEGDEGSLLVREGDVAADYLERLLDIVDYDGDIDLDVENGRAVVAIIGSDLKPLVGQSGETLDALQELTRLAVQQKTGSRSRLMLDVSGHRQARREQLQQLARETAQAVLDSGEPARLTPMNPFERKVVHDAISAIDGVYSESEGEEPNRRVVVLVDA
jgi:spoIIIJ-associated protein